MGGTSVEESPLPPTENSIVYPNGDIIPIEKLLSKDINPLYRKIGDFATRETTSSTLDKSVSTKVIINNTMDLTKSGSLGNQQSSSRFDRVTKETQEIAKAETDPNGLTAHTPGAKMDAGKAPIMQGVLKYFPRALTAVSMVSLAGAKKYDWKGWEEVPDGVNRYENALARHIIAEEIEGPIDKDTQCYHKAQVAWNAFAALELFLREQESKGTL